MGANTFAVTDQSWEQDVDKSKGLVLVDFWAEWCGPCKMVAPVLDEIAAEQIGKLKIGKLDVDSNQDTAMKYGVMSIPTMILFKDGEPIERVVGYKPKAALMQKLSQHLK
jgi:thioredoxin 1